MLYALHLMMALHNVKNDLVKSAMLAAFQSFDRNLHGHYYSV